jgi:two-component system, response regulator YesN
MEQHSSNYRVMIVDDEAIQRTGLIHLCNWSDYGIEIVAEASNGQEALIAVEAYHPHVVITDIVMPVMDGVELTRMLRTQYPHIKIVVLSSYGEFDYVRDVFKYGVTDYLLKPKVSAPELIALIRSLCSDITPRLSDGDSAPSKHDPALLLANWLNNGTASGSLESESLHDLTKQFTNRHLLMAKAGTTLLLSRSKWTQSQMEQHLIRLAAEHLGHYAFTLVFLKQEALLLVNYEPEQSASLQDQLRRFADDARKTLPYIVFVLGRSFDSILQIKSEHERLTPCLGKLLYFPGRSLVPEGRIIASSDSASFDQTRFLAALRALALDDALVQLKAFLSETASNQSYDEYSLKRLCQNMIYSALSTLEPMSLPLPELQSSKLRLFKRIDLAFDIHELENILFPFFEELKEAIRQAEQQPSGILQRIYDYVDKHYANEISLSEMASSLHLNYSYLSSYFKQRTHENLTAYINRVRIDRAKELLRNPELSISEVSRMTGFAEHNYFSKVFKKMTGKTPVEYRQPFIM